MVPGRLQVEGPTMRQMRPRSISGADWLRSQVHGLFPGYFALVMATGIISNTLYF